jgi:hypothetical protein
MFLVLEDDCCVHVYPSPQTAAMAIEALDVEDVVKAAFDEEGHPHRVEWIEPNRYRRIFGTSGSAVNGKYQFVVAGEPDPAALAAIIRQAREIFPKERDQQVKELARRLECR